MPASQALTSRTSIINSVLDRGHESPHASAVYDWTRHLTYGELTSRAIAVAHALREHGIGPGHRVAIVVKRSADVPVLMLAVLFRGASYIPVDPVNPEARMSRILRLSRPNLIVTSLWYSEKCRMAEDIAPIVTAEFLYSPATGHDSEGSDVIAESHPDAPAYIIFTSGTTGEPKGVVISVGSLDRFAASISERLQLDSSHRILSMNTVGFDVSVLEIIVPLAIGADMVLVGDDDTRNLDAIRQYIDVYRPSHVQATPSWWMAALDVIPESFHSIHALVGGEPLPPDLSEAFAQNARSCTNLYGPTESTVWITSKVIEQGTEVSIGSSLPSADVAVIGEGLDHAPDETVGELYCKGPTVALGYHERPGLTAASFVADPTGPPGSRMYRTGDLAVVRNSELQCLGRIDDQIKIRGFRVEVGEIEATLRGVDGVASAVVVPWRQILLAAVTAETGNDPARITEKCLKVAQANLPAYMVPERVFVVPSIPLNINRKADRAKVTRILEQQMREEPGHSTAKPAAEAAGDATPADGKHRGVGDSPILIAVGQVYGESVAPEDSAASLGLQSLDAMRIVGRLRTAGYDVGLRDLLTAPSFGSLGEATGLPTAVETDSPELDLTLELDEPTAPLTPMQRGLWYLDQLESTMVHYHLPMRWEVTSPVDFDALGLAFGDLCRRHSSLRTVIEPTPTPVQRVLERPSRGVTSHLADSRPKANELADQLACEEFNLESDTPLRIDIIEFGPRSSMIQLNLHHIGGDGRSMDILGRDLLRAYRARLGGTPPVWDSLTMQYARYALRVERVLDTDRSTRDREWWVDRLSGIEAECTFPPDRPRPAVPRYRGHRFVVETDFRAGVESAASELGVTPFAILHTALAIQLSRAARTTDVIIGTAVDGRPGDVGDESVGYYVNSLPLHTSVPSDAPVNELIFAVHQDDMAALDHRDVPFEVIVGDTAPPRSRSLFPLFQVMLVMDMEVDRSLGAEPGVENVHMAWPDMAKNDVVLTVVPTISKGQAEWVIEAEIDSTLYSEATARSIVETFATTVRSLLVPSEPDTSRLVAEIDTISPTAARAADALTGPEAPIPGETIPELVRSSLRRHPERTVLIEASGDGSNATSERLTARQFDARVEDLARSLAGIGMAAGNTVAIRLPRSADLLVAVHAVLRSGCAFLPIDPSLPADRQSGMIADAGTSAIIEMSAGGGPALDLPTLPPRPSSSAPRTDYGVPHSTGPAYVLFTSGTTGRPKGVRIPHRAIVNRIMWMQEQFELSADDRVLHKTPTSFDVSVWELLWSFVTDAVLVVAPPEAHKDPDAIAATIRTHSATVCHFVPSVLDSFLASPKVTDCETLRLVVCSGEELKRSSADTFAKTLPQAALFNLYGPTEAAIDVTFHEVSADGNGFVPIGRGVWNTDFRVLDDSLSKVGVGQPGTLYLTGPQLADGYDSRSTTTTAKFVADIDGDGSRMYNTGDTVLITADGTLRYLGRNDNQVKIRGQRIELEDIESVLVGHPQLASAAVVVRNTGNGSSIGAILVPSKTGSAPSADEIAGFAREKLPAHMIPSAFKFAAALPLTTNGKLDRKALGNVDFDIRTDATSPETETESYALGVMRRFADSNIGMDTDFFSAGGHSLLLVDIVRSVHSERGVDISISTLFEDPTPRGLARALHEDADSTWERIKSAEPGTLLPCTQGQQRVWLASQAGIRQNALFNVGHSFAFDSPGEVDLWRLRAAADAVASSEEALRSLLVESDGLPTQKVLEPGHVPVHRGVAPRDGLDAEIRASINAPFDLSREPAFRIHVLDVDDDQEPGCVVVIVSHHAFVDGRSTDLVLSALSNAYAANADAADPQWRAPLVRFAHHCVEAAQWSAMPLGEGSGDAFWRDITTGLPPVCRFSADLERQGEPSLQGGVVAVEIGSSTMQAVGSAYGCTGASTFVLLHAALVLMLIADGAGNDIVVGGAADGRSHAELQDVVGFFAENVVLRTRVDEKITIHDLVRQVVVEDRAALAHQSTPFDRVVAIAKPERDPSVHPLFQVMLAVQDSSSRELTLDGVGREILVDPGIAGFDLTFSLAADPADSSLTGYVEYASDVYTRETVESLVDRLSATMNSMASSPQASVDDFTRREMKAR